MEGEFSSATTLTADERRELYARRDGPGVRRFAIQLGLLAASAVATVALADADARVFWPVFAAYSVLLASMFAPMHEAGHGTAFASKRLNRLVLQLAAGLSLMPPTGFVAFHFEHHRKTHEVGDPEVPGGDLALAAWPKNPIAALIVLSGLPLLLAKLAALVNLAAPRGPKWFVKWMPWLPEVQRPATIHEARIIVAVLVVLVALAWLVWPALGWLLAGCAGAHVVLGPYLAAEHTGMPTDGDVLARTRSVRSNAAVRWLFWNMPYHAEHHGWPAVPFHAVPALHRRVAAGLPRRYRGYLHVYLAALRGR
ncbi:Fatty acid desaturase [Nannocystis exedens]|uniref:Fatty acid desaturase n=1 Tax=Nannocystis exedens TaxID=54 RepID=A0A1I1VXZ5_9BACT|nr:fatty acid desaturase [Nannocystis exedens]PCC72801.1 Fatty acid desaturase [Nannocystis exedens]SFD85903.1 Fatty acid desaturase [Nannocystis exedens]